MDPGTCVRAALAVRDRYAQIERRAFGAPWSVQMRTLGLFGDVGDLAKLLQASMGWRSFERRVYADGPEGDLYRAVRHEVCDCLWSLLVVAAEASCDPLEVASAALRPVEPSGRVELMTLGLGLCGEAGALAELVEVGAVGPFPAGLHPLQGALEDLARTVAAIAANVGVDLALDFVPAMEELLGRSSFDPSFPPTDPVTS